MKCTNPACRNYGKELSPGAKFCGICGQRPAVAPAYESAPSGTPAPRPSGGGLSRGVNKMPQGIALGVDERIVKQYRIGRYTFRKGSIDVIVTNKRVIRYEESSWLGMQNNQIDEINIDAVHGIKTKMSRSISILGLIFSFVLVIFSFIFLGNEFMLPFAIGALALAALVIIFSLKPMLVFSVLGSVGNPALDTEVNLRGRYFRKDGGSAIFQFKPTAETTVMLKEIGACIYDLKTLGDRAIEKWC